MRRGMLLCGSLLLGELGDEKGCVIDIVVLSVIRTEVAKRR